MDGIITPEQLQALEAQAVQEQANLSQASIRPSLERDAALVAEYARKSSQQVRQPSSISEFFFKGPVVPIEERLGYAREAARLQGDIQRRIQEAGLMQGPVQQTKAEQASPQSSPEQPQPTAAPSAPAQPAPAPEKPKYDPFAEFNNYEKTRKKFFSIAFKYVSQVPIQYQDEALKLVKEEWDNTGPSLPKSTLLPLKHPATGEILKDQALTADGRIVELKAPAAEKALTEAQEKNLKFAGAMHRANKEYENLVRASGYDPSNPLNRLPMFEMLKTQNRKLYEGIVNEFTNAINRDQSGASVTPAEFQAAERRYFPLAGDTEEVLKAKEARRKEMVASMYDLVPESARDKIPSYGTNQPQQSAPGGVVEFMRAPGKGGIIKK
jgi:hypothetical protein